MKADPKIDRLLLRYYNGEMSEQEVSQLMDNVKQDLRYQNLMNLYEEFELAFKNPEELEVYMQMLKIDEQSKKRRLSMRLNLKIAATAIILIGVSSYLYFYFNTSRLTNDQIFEKYYLAYSPPDIYRSDNISIEQTFASASHLYSISDYSKALPYFEKLLAADSLNSSLLLYSGVCSTEMNNYHDAISRFNKIISIGDPAYIESAKWYLGLCLLKTGDLSHARSIFQSLSKTKGHYQGISIELLENLTNIKPQQ